MEEKSWREKVCNKYLDENYEHYVVEYRGEFDLEGVMECLSVLQSKAMYKIEKY